MRAVFYKLLTALSNVLGDWFFAMGARFVALGYYCFIPSRTALCARFYGALYPDRGRLYRYYCVWRQYRNFTGVYLDRIRLRRDGALSFSAEGMEKLEEAVSSGRGGVLVMSHAGNWEIAARLLGERRMPLLLYLGAQRREQIEKMQKESVAQSGVRIVAVLPDQGSALDILEAVAFIRGGGLVSMTGDRLWSAGQRSVAARFLGRTARLTESPHHLALHTGAPIFYFFAFKTGPRHYHFSIDGPHEVRAADRADRRAALERSVQSYADALEAMVRRHPYQWYHFEPFLDETGS